MFEDTLKLTYYHYYYHYTHHYYYFFVSFHQLVVAEDTREKDFAVLQRIYRQVLQVSSETFR